jgi:predicted amidohydrolase YtcJ
MGESSGDGAVTGPADLVASGGTVWTGRADEPDARAVAIRAGRVAAVGEPDEMSALIGRDTRMVDLAGRLAVPGFIDAHVHPVHAGIDQLRCDLAEPPVDEDAYVAAVAAYARESPGPWVLGGGWSMAAFAGGVPTRQALDRAVADRPAYFPNRDRHGAWVNSRALELAGVDAATPDPPDGRIEREPDGFPSGMLHEGAMDLVGRLVPAPTRDEQVAALLIGQRQLHAMGVVGWQDAIVGDYAGSGDIWPAYVHAATSDLLTGRVTGALWWDRERGLEQVEELLERRQAGTVGRFRPLAVKIMADGVVEGFTAAMLDPYLDGAGRATDDVGRSFVSAERLRAAVVALDGHGFQLHVHAIGDRAVRDTLDAFEASRAAHGASAGRHQIAHLQVVHPDDVGRFAALDVIATVQSLWACHEPQMDDLTLPLLGADRGGWQYPFGALHRLGTRLACGSDWPVSSPNPLLAIRVAVTRIEPGTDGPPLLPDQALSLATAMRAYTAGSAYATHDDDAGVLQVGARGDLVVLDRDVFAGSLDEQVAGLESAQVDLTVVDGQVVHER